MNSSKAWYQSRTIWGALIAIAASIGSTFGLMISEQEQAVISEAILQITGAIGAFIALYGRLKAEQRVG